MARPFGFPRSEKLKSRKAIEALFLEGKSFAVFPVRVMYKIIPTEKEAGVQVGVTATKKHFKKAVDRNRIKRLLREAYRLQKTGVVHAAKEQGKQLQVFFMYTDKTISTFAIIKQAMHTCLERLERKLEEEHAGTV